MRWVLTGLLGLISLWCTGLNYSCVYLWLARREHHSLGPLVGGVAGMLAMLVCPISAVHRWAWLPLVLDLGCGLLFLNLLYAIFVLKAFSKGR
jgi:hypothetical protein